MVCSKNVNLSNEWCFRSHAGSWTDEHHATDTVKLFDCLSLQIAELCD